MNDVQLLLHIIDLLGFRNPKCSHIPQDPPFCLSQRHDSNQIVALSYVQFLIINDYFSFLIVFSVITVQLQLVFESFS